MAAPTKIRPWRALIILFLVTAGLTAWAFWPGQPNTPRLGLDLQGGTQVTLVPKTVDGGENVTAEQLSQAVEIIRQRVDGVGVAESEVTTQGTGGSAAIVVSVPGENRQSLEQQLAQTALLDFRPVVLQEASIPGGIIDPAADPEVAPGTEATPEVTPGATTEATPRKAKKGSSVALEPTPTPSPTATPTDPKDIRPPIQSPTNNSFLQQAFQNLDCSIPANYQGGTPDKVDEWLVTCASDGTAKYLLEPAFIRGTQVTDAQAQLPEQGAGGWQVNLTFDTDGAKALADVSTRIVNLPPPQNQFGIVLDGLVQSSPFFQEPILGGTASISGNFTNQEAKDLANVLKYGALPVNLTVAEVTSVSPTLGADQLRAGLLAGGLGLLLVALYLLFYYRVLGIVAVSSLLVAALLTYDIFVILSRTVGLALTLAGVAGAIVAIGITADSFVVYFERIRDDVREGKSLRVACETGWSKARNTLLAADFVSLLAAAILYFISIGNVRGFAFVLGLTTIIDVAVAFMFTRPLVAILARNQWFTRGGKLTGVSPERLGVEPGRELLEARAAQAKKKEKVGVSAGTETSEGKDGDDS
ncbi:MAG: protein translocase subunit SecD [Actinobacteria bacterium]|nr:protein translocase subunit SecD [Actinomycetota bacterium]